MGIVPLRVKWIEFGLYGKKGLANIVNETQIDLNLYMNYYFPLVICTLCVNK